MMTEEARLGMGSCMKRRNPHSGFRSTCSTLSLMPTRVRKGDGVPHGVSLVIQ